MCPQRGQTEAELAPDVLDVLVENHRRFLGFLSTRVATRHEAEDILQTAFVKGIQKAERIRDDESAVAWFYRLLRNALVDHYRHHDVARRATERLEREAAAEPFVDNELEAAVCRCIDDLIPTLRAEYATVLRRVDLQDADIAQVAAEQGVTSNNLRVRLHRARRALRLQLERTCGTCAEHGCLDCTCGRDSGGGS